MTELLPTEEQAAICSFVRGSSKNLSINAFAGTGKSSTLRMVNAEFIKEPGLYVVFNKSAKEEAEEKFPSATLVKTWNGLGDSIWRNTVPNIALNPKKMGEFLSEEIKTLKGDDRYEVSDHYFDILDAIRFAKNLGYIPDGKFKPAKSLLSKQEFLHALETTLSPLCQEIVDSLLCQSIQAAYKGGIDFDDQVYMPAMFGGTFPRFARVMVDEFQDHNPVNFEMLKKLARGWLCVVGDEWQSIYAFRGAVRGGMAKAGAHFQTEGFDLSISFRCPQAIVEAARWRVPGFKWKKPGGIYQRLQHLGALEIEENAAIICRNNAPLFRLGFGLIKSGRSVRIAGSDIGPRITRLLKKLGRKENLSRQALLLRIAEWEEEKLEDSKSEATIKDTAECMRIFANFGQTLSQAIAYADHLFAQQGSIQLITGHKAKGKEWNTVYFLDPWLIGRDDQELNLHYVIQTRAKEEAYEIDSRNIDCIRGGPSAK